MRKEVESLLNNLKIKWRIGKPISLVQIGELEKELGLLLPTSYRQFIQELGFLVASGNDYLGFYGKDFTDPSTFIGLTLRMRNEGNIDYSLIAVHNNEDFGIVCLNTEKCINDECEVVFWDPWRKEIIEVIASSYKDFLFAEIASMAE